MSESKLKTFIISLGSNLKHEFAEDNLDKAEIFLRDSVSDEIKFSSHYATNGVGSGKGKVYYNSVCCGNTSLDYENIRCLLKKFEEELGRTKESRLSGIVPIDLDLLQLGDVIYNEKDLRMDYVLRGLDELK